MKNISNFSIFLCLLVLAIILQIILGTLVRITDSGLSCPDWPLCYGLWFPSREKIDLIEGVNFSYFQILLEWIHRLNTALIIVPLTFILFIKSIFQISLKYFKKLMFIIFSLVLIQSLIGGLTVIDKNSPWSVVLHLSLALIFLFLTIRIFIFSINFKVVFFDEISNKNIFWLISSLIIVFITMVLGAVVSKSGASLACSNWPLCNNNLLPSSLDFYMIIHTSHRLFAILSVLSISFFSIYQNPIKVSFIKYLSRLPLILVVIQIFIGGFVIFSAVNFLTSMIHQFTAMVLFITLSVLLSLNLCTFNQQKI